MVQNAGCDPDAHTYASLIDACARACRPDAALRAYHKALRDGFQDCVILYTSAVAACGTVRPVELSNALGIYTDMRRCISGPSEVSYVAVCLEDGLELDSACKATFIASRSTRQTRKVARYQQKCWVKQGAAGRCLLLCPD